MNFAEPQSDADAQPLWQLVPLAAYARPEPPAAEAVRSGLLDLFKRRPAQSEESAVDATDLRRLPEERLNTAAAWPDWRAAVAALDRAMPEFNGSEAGTGRIRTLVGAPYSGIREAVRSWAEHHRWPVIEPPVPERIMAQDESWFETLAADAGPPLVIAELEHCFLRHPFGLSFFRRLLERLHAGRRPGVIVSNSWSWAYLTAALRIDDALAAPVGLQAFDAARLERWFRSLTRFDKTVAFREARDGSLVLTSSGDTTGGAGSDANTPEPHSTYLRRLAGYSRGIPGVAWAIWRRSLEMAVNEEAAPALAEDRHAAAEEVIWVSHWSGDDRLPLLAETGIADLLVLHALLVHGGLPEGAVPDVLSALGAGAAQALRRMAARGIVEEHQGRWQVTPLGYPAVRKALLREGLIGDRL